MTRVGEGAGATKPDLWSVRLLLPRDAARVVADVDAWASVLSPVERIVIGGLLESEVEDDAFVTVELACAGPVQAEEQVFSAVSGALEGAGFRSAELQTVWVAPLQEQDSHRFLEQAKDLYEEGLYDLAVVAAQIHLETQTKLLLRRRGKRMTPGRDADAWTWPNRLAGARGAAALGSDLSLVAVEVLLGVRLIESPHWPAFKAHKARRNGIAHDGQKVRPEDAAESIRVIQALWAELAMIESD